MALTWTLYPVALVAGVGAAWWLGRLDGLPDAVAVSLPILLVGLGLVVAESAVPHHRRWKPGRRVWLTDLTHSLISSAGVPSLLHALLIGSLYAGATWLARWGLDIWPSHTPLAAQLVAALLVAEFGTYWAHRAFHEVGPAWPIHALHHSVEKMHTLAAGRTHPLNVATTFFVGTVPLVLLGAPPDVLALVSVFTAVNGLLQHANIDMRIGPLGWVFAGPDLHHYHHSRVLAESNANYGSNLIVWDVVFGTRHAPLGERPSPAVGLNEASLPERIWLHFILPFVYTRQTTRYRRPDLAPAQPSKIPAQLSKIPAQLSKITNTPQDPWPAPSTPTQNRRAIAS
jgi:sterol desaturase/sphingolipid hydroxylase (fatty acid hydroxylase superfamily)